EVGSRAARGGGAHVEGDRPGVVLPGVEGDRDVLAAPGRAAPADRGDAGNGPSGVPGPGHASERRADEDVDADVDGDGVAGQAEDRDRAAVRGGEDTEALRLARLHGDGGEGDVTERLEDLLDAVVGPRAHAAGRDDGVDVVQAVREDLAQARGLVVGDAEGDGDGAG